MNCQRWRERRGTYRPKGEPIDTTRYGVEVVRERDARAFVEQHHYSAAYVAARLAVGLYRQRDWFTPELVGVAVFSNPPNEHVVPCYAPGLDPSRGTLLGRFVLLDDVPANGETWFLARAFRALRREKPGLDIVIAYSDPVPRTTTEGQVVMPGHVGTIYQAHNAAYLGRSSKSRLWMTPDGVVVSRRGLTKIVGGEVGGGAALRRLLARGAPPRRLGESPRDYVARALREGPFRAVQHPGNHVYAWPLAGRVELRQGTEYPKRNAA